MRSIYFYNNHFVCAMPRKNIYICLIIWKKGIFPISMYYWLRVMPNFEACMPFIRNDSILEGYQYLFYHWARFPNQIKSNQLRKREREREQIHCVRCLFFPCIRQPEDYRSEIGFFEVWYVCITGNNYCLLYTIHSTRLDSLSNLY